MYLAHNTKYMNQNMIDNCLHSFLVLKIVIIYHYCKSAFVSIEGCRINTG